MLKVEFSTFVSQQAALRNEEISAEKPAREKEINAGKPPSRDPNHDVARGQLIVYSALEKSMKKEKLSLQELGVIGAINDVLQKLNLISSKETLLSKIDGLP